MTSDGVNEAFLIPVFYVENGTLVFNPLRYFGVATAGNGFILSNDDC